MIALAHGGGDRDGHNRRNRKTQPPPHFEIMFAWAGIEWLRFGWTNSLDHAPRPRWPLDAPDMLPEQPIAAQPRQSEVQDS